MTDAAWLLYGANGYTGELICDLALARGKKPILAGRNRGRIEAMGERLGLPTRVFALDDVDRIAHELSEVEAVVLAAGPFSATSAPVVEACLRSSTHYLDITGELSVFEACLAAHDRAVEAGCTILPGVGFDVVPTDCLAVALVEALPTANELEIAVQAMGSFSQGTGKSALEALGGSAYARRDGRLVAVPMADREIEADFGDHRWPAVSAPIADVITAHVSTGIPNIETFVALPPRIARQLHRVTWALPIMRSKMLQKIGGRLLELRERGPDEHAHQTASGHAWGRVTDPDGQTRSGHVRTPEVYRFTADATLVCLDAVLAGEAEPGFATPASAFGSDLILRCEGCTMSVG